MIELIMIFIFGLLIGSFLNVVIIRLPEDKSIAFPASHCVHCNKKLKFYHNIPLLSWIALGGKCAYCKKPISKQYPLIELLTGIIFLAVFYKFGIGFYAFGISVVFTLLLALSAIDWKYKMVPDSLNLLALTVAIVSAFNLGGILNNFINALLFAGGFSLLRFYVSYLAKKEAMGEADIMIAATMGAVLGIKLGFISIFIGAIIAIVPLMLNIKGKELPFIPFLALGAFVTLMFDVIINNYLVGLYG